MTSPIPDAPSFQYPYICWHELQVAGQIIPCEPRHIVSRSPEEAARRYVFKMINDGRLELRGDLLGATSDLAHSCEVFVARSSPMMNIEGHTVSLTVGIGKSPRGNWTSPASQEDS